MRRRISTASGSERDSQGRPSAGASLATARGTDSAPVNFSMSQAMIDIIDLRQMVLEQVKQPYPANRQTSERLFSSAKVGGKTARVVVARSEGPRQSNLGYLRSTTAPYEFLMAISILGPRKWYRFYLLAKTPKK